MPDALQDAVEALAQLLGRSVEVDDAGLRLLASSTHFEDADEARVGTLVGRRVLGPARDYVFASGAQQWRLPTRMPAQPDIGLRHDRIAFPLRSRYELLGFMWLIHDDTLTDEHLAEAEATARELERILARRLQILAETDLEIESLLVAVIAADRSARQDAARDLRDLGLFPGSVAFHPLALSFDDTIDLGADSPRAVVRRALGAAASGRFRGRLATTASGAEATAILGVRVLGAGADAELRGLADAVLRDVRRGSPALAESVTVGIGPAVSRLDDADGSYERAVTARDAARAGGRPVGVWGDDPATEYLLALALLHPDDAAVPDVLRTAAACQPDEVLLAAEAVLDAGGDVSRAAVELGLHRTTVYHRLRRLERSTGLSLARGDHRLMLHLWLRSRRLRDVG